LKTKGRLNLISAISIGIGGMVGGGIFAVLGLSVVFARGAVPLAFLYAGVIAFITSYSYARLSVAYPDKGGTVRFINEGFGITVFSGGLNNLLWISYIIMLSLYASAFGSYAASIIHITGNRMWDVHILVSAIIIISTILNYFSIKLVGEVESIVVIIKMTILLVFVAVGLIGITHHPEFVQLSPAHWESTLKIIAGGMVIFVAYEGFELIANSAPDITRPRRNLPLAYFLSVIIVMMLYIAISVVTVGSLSFSAIDKAQDYALAEAARPKFGEAGFFVIAIAAMLSTFSAINATLLGGSRVNYEEAEDKELPREFTRQYWGKPVGLVFISIATLLIANTIDLESISTSGSAGFLLIFGMVNLVAYRKARDIGARRIIALIGAILCLLAFLVLIVQQARNNLTSAIIPILIIIASFLGEYIYRKTKKKPA
jgi:amino acid transporter